MKEIIVYGVVAGLAVGNIASWMLLPKPQSLGVIDMQFLITEQAQALAKSGQLNPRQVQTLADRLKEELQEFAHTKGVVLLAKGAIVGGNLPEFTDQFLKGR